MRTLLDPEWLEDELDAIVHAGRYRSKQEALQHALEVLLVANPSLRFDVAIELFRRGKITLARGAEIAGIELEAFKEALAELGIPLVVDADPAEVASNADMIGQIRK